MSNEAATPSGELFVVSAPSGAGKTSLLRCLFERYPKVTASLAVSVSHTTRPARDGEVDGKDYHFVSKQTFEELIEAGDFLEWALVHGHYKGTSLQAVQQLRGRSDVLLEIDVQGAAQIRRQVTNAVTVFVLPPSYPELERRLRGRESDSEAQIRQRLADAASEIRQSELYDYVIVNEQLDHACEALATVFQARHYRRARMQTQIDQVLATLPSP